MILALLYFQVDTWKTRSFEVFILVRLKTKELRGVLTLSALKVSMNFSNSSGGRKSPIKCFPLPISVRDSAHSGNAEIKSHTARIKACHFIKAASSAAACVNVHVVHFSADCSGLPRVFSISICLSWCSQVPASWSTSSSLSYSCWWSLMAFSHILCISAIARLCFMIMSYISCIWGKKKQHVENPESNAYIYRRSRTVGTFWSSYNLFRNEAVFSRIRTYRNSGPRPSVPIAILAPSLRQGLFWVP